MKNPTLLTTLALAVPLALAQAPVQARDLTVVNFGGANGDAQTAAFIQPYEKETGKKIIPVAYNGEQAKVKAMVQSKNVVWDAVEVETGDLGRGCDEGLYENIDWGSILNKGDLVRGALKYCGVGTFVWSTVLAYNADTLKTPPTGWADFWDVKKFPGKRGLRKGAHYNVEFALMADGVPHDKLYPLDIDRAFKKLDELKPHVSVWVENTGQFDVLLQNAEVDMMMDSLGRSTIAKGKGLPVDYTMNDGLWQQSYWIVPKDAPNAENAMKLIAWMSQAQNEAEFVKIYPYGMPNKKSYDLMSAETKANIPTSPQNLPMQAQIDAAWWTANNEEVNRRWLDWYSKR